MPRQDQNKHAFLPSRAASKSSLWWINMARKKNWKTEVEINEGLDHWRERDFGAHKFQPFIILSSEKWNRKESTFCYTLKYLMQLFFFCNPYFPENLWVRIWILNLWLCFLCHQTACQSTWACRQEVITEIIHRWYNISLMVHYTNQNIFRLGWKWFVIKLVPLVAIHNHCTIFFFK